MGTTAAIKDLPRTLAEHLAADMPLRAPASLERYLEFAASCEYRVEYSNGNIIAMSSPTDTHELICGNIIRLLGNLLLDDLDFRVYASNLGVLVSPTAHYKPDAVVVQGEPAFKLHKLKKITAKSLVNPFAVVEVFSDGTIDYDLTEKLPNFKKCPSLQYIIYIHQHSPFVTLYTRSDQPGRWLAEDFNSLDSEIDFVGKKLSLRQLYRQVVFGDRPGSSGD